MSEEKRHTIAGWVHELEAPDARLTLWELMALTLLHIRENVKDARLGTEHLEAMVGTLDELMAATNPIYGELAARRARPAAAMPAPEGS